MGRHDVDPVSLLSAAFAIAGAVLYLLHDAGRITLPVNVVVALVTVGVGVIAIAWALPSRTRRQPPG